MAWMGIRAHSGFETPGAGIFQAGTQTEPGPTAIVTRPRSNMRLRHYANVRQSKAESARVGGKREREREG